MEKEPHGDKFEGVLSAEQRAGLCKFLNIPEDSADDQIIWAFRNHWKEFVTGATDPKHAAPSVLDEAEIVRMIKENWGGDSEFPKP